MSHLELLLKSGRMSVSRIEAAGIDYSLATDVGAGTAMSLFIEMRHADYTQPDSSISPQKAFYLATLAGAKVMSMEADVGNFQPGKYADFSILDINGIDRNYSLAGMDTDELLSCSCTAVTEGRSSGSTSPAAV